MLISLVTIWLPILTLMTIVLSFHLISMFNFVLFFCREIRFDHCFVQHHEKVLTDVNNSSLFAHRWNQLRKWTTFPAQGELHTLPNGLISSQAKLLYELCWQEVKRKFVIKWREINALCNRKLNLVKETLDVDWPFSLSESFIRDYKVTGYSKYEAMNNVSAAYFSFDNKPANCREDFGVSNLT